MSLRDQARKSSAGRGKASGSTASELTQQVKDLTLKVNALIRKHNESLPKQS